MTSTRDKLLVLLALLTLDACAIHRLPEQPPARDPASADARGTPYEPPPDLLETELSSGAANDHDDPHAGHHHRHGGDGGAK